MFFCCKIVIVLYFFKFYYLSVCAKFRIEQINDNIFKDGVYPVIDTIVEKQNQELDKLAMVRGHIDKLFEKEKLPKNSSNSYSDLKYLESEGYFVKLVS